MAPLADRVLGVLPLTKIEQCSPEISPAPVTVMASATFLLLRARKQLASGRAPATARAVTSTVGKPNRPMKCVGTSCASRTSA
ncbi:hypothetical protein JaAD80_28115 [Janthinobacterium sp. AD80]|nr:hypothetical protein JaAD80_28115 [Janthinobacterium sp. AD80]